MTTILTNKQKTILKSFTSYRSSIDEESYYKGIDIKYLFVLRKSLEDCLLIDQEGVVIIYRITVECMTPKLLRFIKDKKITGIGGIG